jgi:hypothetical protein
MPSEQLVKELQVVVLEDYGVSISLSDAEAILSNLTSYFDLLAKINYKENDGSEK